LFLLYALSWCVMAMAFTATASIGAAMSVAKNLTLLPLITHVLGSVIITVPASKMMIRFSRRVGLATGCLLGMLGSTLCVYGVYVGNFWIVVCSTPFIGMFTGFSEFVKYAAGDIFDDEDRKRRSISIIVSSGIIAAFVGPWVAGFSNDYFMYIKPYFGPYLSVFGFCGISLILSLFLTVKPIAQNTAAKTQLVGLKTVLNNKSFVAGTLVSAVAYLVMAAMMDAMPITMLNHSLNFDHTTHVLQWHLLAMFAPSYITAKLINHFGVRFVVLNGIVINAIGVGFALGGTEFYNFWLALFFIGLGWNLMYLSGVGIIATTPDDIRPTAEGYNNTVLVTCFAISAPIASVILFQFGWVFVSLYALILLCAALIPVLTTKYVAVAESRE